jgi:hypothetical protein
MYSPSGYALTKKFSFLMRSMGLGTKKTLKLKPSTGQQSSIADGIAV